MTCTFNVTWSSPSGSHVYTQRPSESLSDAVARMVSDLMIRVPESATEICVSSECLPSSPLCLTRLPNQSKVAWLRSFELDILLALGS
jgi:hypothetical protein